VAYLECAKGEAEGLGPVGTRGKVPIGGLADKVPLKLKLIC